MWLYILLPEVILISYILEYISALYRYPWEYFCLIPIINLNEKYQLCCFFKVGVGKELK